jgi:aminopeptidase N
VERPGETPALHRLADYAPPPFLVGTVDLDVELDAERTLVRSRLTIRRAPGADPAAPLRLDGEGLELVSIALDGEPLSPNRFSRDDAGLTIADVQDAFTLETVTAIVPARNKSGMGLFELQGKLATQCEAEGFRRITYFPDRPDVLATYTVTLHADAARYPVLLSNGDRVGVGAEPGGRHWARWHDPFPKPSYIFALVAGDLTPLSDSFVTASGRKVDLAIWSDAELSPQCRFAMDVVKRSLDWDERTYGLEYDLATYNVAALSGWSGAMENKGLSIFGASGVITDPEISTDDDYIIIERIVGHEQFHNWTGNRVTCRDWFQLCLKEGLTRFRDQHFIEDKLASGVYRIEQVKALRRNQFPEDDGPAAHAVQPAAYAEIDNFYTNTIYDKGAEVVRMLRALLGPAAFRQGFDRYIARHDGQAVTIEEFVRAMEDASGRDLGQFRRWHSQAGRPRVTASGDYDAAARQYRLTLQQTCPPTPGQPVKAPFHIPVGVGLISEAGAPLAFSLDGAAPAEAATLELQAVKQTFTLEGVASRPIPSLLRAFSAPVTLDAGLSDDDLAILTASDPDPFCRWDASQTLAIRLVRRLAADHSAGRAMAAPERFITAIGQVLEDEAASPLLRAQILALPDEPVLSEGLARIDLDGHMAARNFLRSQIATRLQAPLLARYDALADAGPYAPDIAGIGRRKLRNTVLDLLTALGTDEVADLALAQVEQATNMTDRFEALCLIAHLDCPQRDRAIEGFYQRWKDRPTVVDKWFNAQALSRAPGAVARIIALEQHPAFDPANFSQSLVYYGGFFRQNRVAFHDPSGRGYEFLADRLLRGDAQGRAGSTYLMPQINQRRRYDEARQGLMRAALTRVAETPGISKGLAENIGKALN